ncbi:hypothetical protein [Bradyrhizobium erythrophlei]|jgi:hypothetical protein|uniref:Uncharacterized protein n=1 Tax=Bradyrhizobium erythrophlei TaxID=1437360 RepID=A0A1M7UCU0_9BRAD|nr:hypothetical protein [Bradyrhizobium erythrophlei]SHN80819.1 hypothetical protein SAMN05444170_4516 [Bradyrhizobium erythrophlei]
MTEDSDRKELERRLAQARRMVEQSMDALTTERLQELIRDLEEQLK